MKPLVRDIIELFAVGAALAGGFEWGEAQQKSNDVTTYGSNAAAVINLTAALQQCEKEKKP